MISCVIGSFSFFGPELKGGSWNTIKSAFVFRAVLTSSLRQLVRLILKLTILRVFIKVVLFILYELYVFVFYAAAMPEYRKLYWIVRGIYEYLNVI